MVAAVAAELRRDWTGARVERVVQPAPLDVCLQLYRAGRQTQLALSAHPELARAHPGASRPRAAPTPPAFCQVLRRHLESSRMLGCTQPGLERLLQLEFEGRDELGNPRRLLLVVELTGRLANMVLLGPDGRILEALRRVDEDRNRVREILPGLPYVPPPRPEAKIDPVECLRAEGALALVGRCQAAWASRPPQEPDRERLQATIFGLTRPLASAAAAWAAGAAEPPPDPLPPDLPVSPLARAVAALAASVVNETFQPQVAIDGQGRPMALAWPLPGLPCSPAETAGQACAEAYAILADRHREQGLRQRIGAVLRAARLRVARRLEKQEEEHRCAAGAETLREAGEILLCYPHLVPRGASRVALPAVDGSARTVDIDLDPRQNSIANAQRLLRRYHKEKRAAAEVAARLATGRAERAYLDEALLALEQAEGPGELEALEAELTEQGLLTPTAARERRRGQSPTHRQPPRRPAAAKGRAPDQGRPGPAPPLSFSAAGGWQILVGRNATGNDSLTMRLARPGDIWLHARQMPGSHVLLRAPAELSGPAATQEPEQEALLAAARCAAYYSAGRAGAHIPIDWTRRRHVWKPAGARPGFVLYEGERTLIVDPGPLPPRAEEAALSGPTEE